MKLHIVIHESFETAGAIEHWAQINSCEVSYTHLYQGGIFPSDMSSFDCLIVMGGPQSPKSTVAEYPHFDAGKEINFIKNAIAADKLLLGVCLGAQLIGEAMGAKFEQSPHREIGVFELSLTEEANQDPIFKTFPKTFPVCHWHEDMPGLTKESKVLAKSEGCPRQIIRYSPKVYGFQCHFEYTPEIVEGMIQNCGYEIERYKSHPYITPVEEFRSNNFSPINSLLFNFFDQIKLFKSN